MALMLEQSWKFVQRVEKELQAKLGEGDPAYREIEHRSACENLIFQDFQFAHAKHVEARLWDAHSRINSKFRKNLATLRDEDGKKRPVEIRKLIKQYLDFIKSSQRFYRGYIQRLASHFGGVPEVERVAHLFKLSTLSATDPVEASADVRQMILVSCHQTLVRLGDLSRYRETELGGKTRNWGPAIGYYELAGAIHPASGASHNQLAVIALADGNHLRATFHLYRALAAEEPHPSSRGNLEIEFKKILAAWSKGELIVSGAGARGEAGKALLAWFVRLHARCYKGQEFAEHEELENEVLGQLAVDLKERSLDSTLQKFIIINVAAEYCAGVRVQEKPDSKENYQSFFFFLRLNVKTFFALLQLLQPELESVVNEEANATGHSGSSNGSERVTAVTRRILPGLRQYSSWLMSSSALLVAQVGDSSLNTQIKELWKIYANSLTLLAATFSPEQLPSVEYLLEEDADTLGFKPFGTEHSEGRYLGGNNQAKPRITDPGVEREHVNVEMLSRVRDFLTDGLKLSMDEDVPIALLEGGTFAYQEDGLASQLLTSPNVRTSVPVAEPEQESGEPGQRKAPVHVSHHQNGGSAPRDIPAPAHAPDDNMSLNPDGSSTASISMSAKMHNMVDALVDNEESNPEPSPTTVGFPPLSSIRGSTPLEDDNNEHLSTLSPAQLVQMVRTYSPRRSSASQPRQQHTPRPSLPSIWNTPFAPEPQEDQQLQQSPSTRPGTARAYNESSSFNGLEGSAPPGSGYDESHVSWESSGLSSPGMGYGAAHALNAKPSPALGLGLRTRVAQDSSPGFSDSLISPYWTQRGGTTPGSAGLQYSPHGQGGLSRDRSTLEQQWTPPNGQGSLG